MEKDMNDKIMQYYRLIYRVMIDLHCSQDDEVQDEMFFEGLMGLYNGIRTYDVDGEASETTYYYVCIRNAITNKFRSNSYEKRNINKIISLETKLYGDVSIEETLCSNLDIEYELIKEEQLNCICKVLNKTRNSRFKQYFCDFYGIGMPRLKLKEIAQKYGVSTHNVGASLRQGIGRLKKKVKKEYEKNKNDNKKNKNKMEK